MSGQASDDDEHAGAVDVHVMDVMDDDDDDSDEEAVQVQEVHADDADENGDDEGDEEEVMAAVVIEDEEDDDEVEDEEEEEDVNEVQAVSADDDTSNGQPREDFSSKAPAPEAQIQMPANHYQPSGKVFVPPSANPQAQVAAPSPLPPPSNEKKPPARKRAPKKQIAEAADDDGGSKTTPGKATKTTPAASSKKKRQRSKQEAAAFARISATRLKAAEAARKVLVQSVPQLPIQIDETFTVRNLGQLWLGDSGQFSTTNALYPVGFCVDRYEFCPTHGRMLKLRCSILDGAHVKEQQAALGVEPSQELPDGPLFRIMWGQGVDDDTEVEYPYDPYSNSAPITTNVGGDSDAIIAIPATGEDRSSLLPVAGMKVKVRFENDQYYYGTLVKVEKQPEKNKKKSQRPSAKIWIQYDYGSTEDLVFPDPDVVLVMPGKEDKIMTAKLALCSSLSLSLSLSFILTTLFHLNFYVICRYWG